MQKKRIVYWMSKSLQICSPSPTNCFTWQVEIQSMLCKGFNCIILITVDRLYKPLSIGLVSAMTFQNDLISYQEHGNRNIMYLLYYFIYPLRNFKENQSHYCKICFRIKEKCRKNKSFNMNWNNIGSKYKKI